MTPPCRPTATWEQSFDDQTACNLAIICQRCGCCLLHCSCPPVELQARDPEALARKVRTMFATRRVKA